MYHSINFSLISTIVITNLPNGCIIYFVNFGVLKSQKLANHHLGHTDDILGARMLWKPKEARVLKNFIDQPV
jgi:hypothetical protein